MATKDVEPVGEEGIELKEANEGNHLHVISGAQDVPVEVDINIATVGKIGSGRYSFVNVITGM